MIREELEALVERIDKIRSELDLDNESESYWVSLQVDALADCVKLLCQLLAREAEQRDRPPTP